MMGYTKVLVLVFLVITIYSSSSRETNDQMFIVLLTTNETKSSTLVFHDMYCLDPVVPKTEEECNYRVLAPVDGYFTNTNIIGMSIDFEHPSNGTHCRINWEEETEDVEVTCDEWKSWYSQLPAFRAVKSTSGLVTVEKDNEDKCTNNVSMKWYYKFGLKGCPERRPAVVFIFEEGECPTFSVSLAGVGDDGAGGAVNASATIPPSTAISSVGIIFGRPDRSWTMINNCVYNKRRRCRPVRNN
ncbi:uncharacterized protein LOC124162434 [Ischnura elegans]|uniref:uncharacterized protein LOC124162434 n=1 Tax=Ischnura elegans TaxID=197161 RepID=UPI001ED887DB|nr:uncharacterized protein LOC124162434 [Ischnura elegans]